MRIWKFQFFVQYLTVQIVLTERKTSLFTVFLQLLKIMTKKAWNLKLPPVVWIRQTQNNFSRMRFLRNLKKYTHKLHTFFYVTPNTHITPFHTNNNF